MRMAKASDRDLDMALNLIGILDDIESGHFPYRFSDPDDEATEWLDPADREQMTRLLYHLKRHLAQGSIGRVILGMAALCDPKNRLLDPDADHLTPHSRFELLEELTNPPPQPDDYTGRYCYSLDEEAYRGQYTTPEAAAAQAEADIDDDEADGVERRYWIAECANPLELIQHDKLHRWSGDSIIEQFDERCNEEVYAEDAILDMTPDDTTLLGQIVHNFIRSRAKVMYYGIKNPVEHTYTAGTNDLMDDITHHVRTQLNTWIAERRSHAA